MKWTKFWSFSCQITSTALHIIKTIWKWIVFAKNQMEWNQKSIPCEILAIKFGYGIRLTEIRNDFVFSFDNNRTVRNVFQMALKFWIETLIPLIYDRKLSCHPYFMCGLNVACSAYGMKLEMYRNIYLNAFEIIISSLLMLFRCRLVGLLCSCGSAYVNWNGQIYTYRIDDNNKIPNRYIFIAVSTFGQYTCRFRINGFSIMFKSSIVLLYLV